MSLKSSHLLSWLCKETFLLEFLRHPCDHKSWKENLLHNLSNQYKLLKWVTIHIWFSFLRISWGFLFSCFLSKYRETSLARFSNKNSFYMMKLKPFSMSSLCARDQCGKAFVGQWPPKCWGWLRTFPAFSEETMDTGFLKSLRLSILLTYKNV